MDTSQYGIRMFLYNPDLLYVQVTVHCDNRRINNQQAASSIQNFICYETPHASGIFCAHHQELSAAHVAIGMFHAGYVVTAQESQVGTDSQCIYLAFFWEQYNCIYEYWINRCNQICSVSLT